MSLCSPEIDWRWKVSSEVLLLAHRVGTRAEKRNCQRCGLDKKDGAARRKLKFIDSNLKALNSNRKAWKARSRVTFSESVNTFVLHMINESSQELNETQLALILTFLPGICFDELCPEVSFSACVLKHLRRYLVPSTGQSFCTFYPRSISQPCDRIVLH